MPHWELVSENMLSPQDAFPPEQWNAKGLSSLRVGRYEGAIECFDKAIEILENSGRRKGCDLNSELMLVAAWRSKGIGFYELNRYREAIKCFDVAIKTYENVQALDKNDTTTTTTTKVIEDISFTDRMYYCIANIWYEKGLSYSNLEDYEQAKECFDKAIEIDPNFADARHNKGISLGNLEEYQEAIKCFDMVIDKDPNDADAWRNKGFVLSKLRGDIDKEVIECFDKAIEIKPYFAYAWNSKGYAFLKFKEKNGRSDEYDTKGILDNAIEGEKYEQAIQCFNEAIKTDPNFVHAWYNKGYALICQKKYEDALECIDKATNIDPKNPYAWNYKGYAHLGLKRYDDAIRDFDKAIEIDSKGNIEAWNYKGISILCSPAKDCFDRAVLIYEQIRPFDKAIDTDFAYALNSKGYYLITYSPEKYDKEATECFDRAIKIRPDFVYPYYNKSFVLSKLGKYDQAIKYLDKAIKVDADLAHAWNNKGYALNSLGKYAEAVKCFDNAVSIYQDKKRRDDDGDADLKKSAEDITYLRKGQSNICLMII